MKRNNWNPEKNEFLKQKRGIGFEDIVVAILEKRILDIVQHPQEKRPGQKYLIVEIDDYAYVVPFVETEEERFFKTVFPSRKYTKIYLRKQNATK
jgi:uncharacterized DUF497 family protein